MEETISVLVQVSEDGCITAVSSSAFQQAAPGWRTIDHGLGDRYLHAQGNYLPGDLFEPDGVCCWMTAPARLHPGREAFVRYPYGSEEWGIYLRTQAEKAESSPGGGSDANIGLRVTRLEQQTGEMEQMLDMILTGVTMDE